jgi:hypothetical protein
MNRATRTIVTILGIALAFSGMSHGFFETLQGNTSTPGLIIDAIGQAHRMWAYGREGALTLIPNFLLTGLAALISGLVIIIWSVGFINHKHGPLIFLLLFIALFLAGGGVAQLPFFLLVWGFSTRINKPLTRWRKVLPAGLRGMLAGVWPWTLAAGLLHFLLALEIAIFGVVPGVDNPDQRLGIVYTSLGIDVALIAVTFVGGIAQAMQAQTQYPNHSTTALKRGSGVEAILSRTSFAPYMNRYPERVGALWIPRSAFDRCLTIIS